MPNKRGPDNRGSTVYIIINTDCAFAVVQAFVTIKGVDQFSTY